MRIKSLMLYWTMCTLCVCIACSDSSVEETCSQEDYIAGDPVACWPLSDDLQSCVEGVNEFAIKQLREAIAKSPATSLVISPLSTTFALGMLTYAAAGETQECLTSALGFPSGDTQALCDFCASSILGLPVCDPSVTVVSANALFANKDAVINTSFRRVLRKYFSADVQSLDFASPSALNTINSWCKAGTAGIIPALLDKIDAHAQSYIINTLSLKASWTMGFDKQRTSAHPFVQSSGQTVQCQAMRQSAIFPYAKTKKLEAIRLPLGDEGLFSVTVVLPQSPADPANISDALTPQFLTNLSKQMTERKVNLTLPRFDTETQLELPDMLKNIGMAKAFSEEADYPLVYEYGSPFSISRMFQKTHIDLSESGLHAASATVIAHIGGSTTPGGSLSAPPINFTADHTFLYIVTEQETGLILFAGIYDGEIKL